MDNIDVKILNCLRNNSRENASVIAEVVGLSVSTVSERIKKLENSGIIKQYTIVFDNKQLGRDCIAFVNISLEHSKFTDSFAEFVRNNNSIVECYYIAGDFDFQVKIVTESTKSLEKVLQDIKGINCVAKTKTNVVLSSIKEDVNVPLKKIKTNI